MKQNSSSTLGLWLAAVLALLSSCGSSSGSARTVSYFQAHPEERETASRRCADDPGTLGKSPECVNANQAEAIAGIGSFRHLPPMQFPKVPARKAEKVSDAPGGNRGS